LVSKFEINRIQISIRINSHYLSIQLMCFSSDFEGKKKTNEANDQLTLLSILNNMIFLTFGVDLDKALVLLHYLQCNEQNTEW
jgi:hypothetical protein